MSGVWGYAEKLEVPRVNFVKCSFLALLRQNTHAFLAIFVIVALFTYSTGCRDQVRLPSANQLAEFESAGPIGPAVDVASIVRAKIIAGPYRVVQSEVIELTMPTILQVVTAEDPRISEKATPYVCRVSENGTIALPAVGEIQAAGMTLAQIEAAVVGAYYPAYAVTRPSVFARILEYKTAKVSINGAVQKPGIYSLHSDQMSLVALLMEAGGIVENGAALIQITHAPEAVPEKENASTGTTQEKVEDPAIRKIQQTLLKETLGGIVENATRRLTEPNMPEVAVSAKNHPDLDDMEIRLSFAPESTSGTIGRCIIRHDNVVLLSERIDVNNEDQRHALLGSLLLKEPRVSFAQAQRIEKSLCALAGQLKPGLSKGSSENGTGGGDLAAKIEVDINDLKRAVTSDEAVEKLEGAFDIIGWDKRLGKRETPERVAGERTETVVLPVKGLNIPFADIALDEGDSVTVEPFQVPLFSVIGLVNKPSNFPYPPEVKYNLMQAIAFAGGLDTTAEPRYATIYRLKSDGTIVRSQFEIISGKNGAQLTDALNVPVKPGDIVAIEHTPRTRSNLFLDKFFRVNIGLYVPLTDIGRQR